MKVRDLMSVDVETIDVETTVAAAARRMADDDIGAFPIVHDGKLTGFLTDRDIAVRAVGTGLPSCMPVGFIMSESVKTCSPEDDIGTVLALMAREQIRRMPVCNESQEIVGLVSLADAANRAADKEDVADTLAEVSKPRGLHCHAGNLI